MDKQFVVWYYNCCSTASLTDYANKERFQELPTECKYSSTADRRIYIDLRNSKGYVGELEKLKQGSNNLTIHTDLKNALTKKWGWDFWDIFRENICTCWQTEASQWGIKHTVHQKRKIFQVKQTSKSQCVW